MFLSVLNQILTIQVILPILLGTIVGTIFGAVPGLTTVMGIALLLPVTYYMSPMPAISMLLGVYCGGISGGLISAILLGIPGTPASIVTTFDGYPLAKKGKAGEALAVGIFVSFIGGMFSAVALSFLAPQLSRLVLRFGPFEYFALGVCGLSIVASLSKGNTLKGLIAASLGLCFALIGPDPVLGLSRFDFGLTQFAGGISFIPALIGLFAVSQAFEDIQHLSHDSLNELNERTFQFSDFCIPWKKIFDSWSNIIRSSVIGILIGVLPGVGGPVASFLSYEQAKQTSKNKKDFGHGAIEGVIASETSNNAVTGGALSCLISLGLPGDGATVALLGGLMIHGLRPGPLFIVERPDIVYGIFAAFFIANILVFVTQYWGIRVYAQILKVPTYILIPIIFVMCLIGSYALNRQMFDVWMMVFFSLIGYAFRKLEYPLAPFILAFILGPMVEANLRRAMSIYRGNFFSISRHPIALILFAIGLMVIVLSFKKVGKGLKD